MVAQYTLDLVHVSSGKKRSAFVWNVLIFVIAMFAFNSALNAQINYFQGWEAAGNGGWTFGGGADRSTSTPCTGVASVRRSFASGLASESGTVLLTSPLIGTSNGLGMTYSFTFRRSSDSGFGSLISRWGTSPTGPWNATTHTVSNQNCTIHTVNFTPPAGQAIYIQLQAVKNSVILGGSVQFYFDNVTVTQAALICPAATFSSIDDCGAGQFSIDANISVSGTGASLAYSVDGAPALSLPIPSPGNYSIGPFASTSIVEYSLTNVHSALCDDPIIGNAFSNCPVTLTCGIVHTFSHCYTNNDQRTFTYVNPDPDGKVSIKFLPTSPVAPGDGVTFWDGMPNTMQFPLIGVGDLSSHGNILSPGNIFSFNIQSDGSGSCADGALGNDWTFEVKCVTEGGCAEPQGDVLLSTDCAGGTFSLGVDLYDLGWNGTTGDYPGSAGIRYSVDGGAPVDITGLIEGFHDLGVFPLWSSVNITLLNEDDAVCHNNLGAFTKNAACPPANDQCANAQPLPIGATGSCPASATPGSTLDANGANPPSCAGAGPIQDVWYTFNTASFASPIAILLSQGPIGGHGMSIHSSCTGAELACTMGSTLNFTSFTPGTTYYLRVFTTDGVADQFSICISANICAPTFSQNVEPICRVQFAGIDNSSSNTVNGSPALQDFTGTVAPAQVTGGSTYPISVRGNTDGNWTNYFTVFFDWNGDGSFDLPGTPIGSITNNGNCTAAATTNITVPISAVGGLSRMRIVKDYASSAIYPSAPCGAYDYGQAEDYLVNVTPCIGAPPSVSASSNSPVCHGAQIELNATSSGSIFSWIGPNNFTSTSEDPVIANAIPAMAGTYTVTARSVAGGCPATASTTVSLTAPPAPVNAGLDKTICSTAGSVAMTATAPTSGTGVWTKIAGGSASIANPSSPSTNITGLNAAGSPYTFRWTVSNPPCASAFDDVIVNVDAAPTAAIAGADLSICGNMSAMLEANLPTTGTGAWSIVSGPSSSLAQFSSITDPAATFDPIAASGSYILRWTMTNGICTASSDDVVLTVMLAPGEPIATTSMAICEDASVPAGTGLSASCPPILQMNNVAFPGSNFPSEGTSLTTRSTLTLPALPTGAMVMGARLKLFNVVAQDGLLGDGQRQNIRVALSGAYTLAETQITTQTGPGTVTPDPVINLPGFTVSSGNINLRTRQTSDQFWTSPDATIGSASIEVDYSLPGTVGWFTAVSGGQMVGTGVFDPVAASLVDSSIPGSTTFYAGCVFNACGSIGRLPATFTVNAKPAVDAGEYLGICSVDAPIQLGGSPSSGVWSGTGVIGNAFDPSVGTQTLTYDHTDANGCSNSDEVQIVVEQAVAWYADVDGDGLGDLNAILMACDQPAGFVSNSNDACPNDPLNDQDGDGICGDADSCPSVFGEVGWACDAGPGFILGELTSDCACVGIACSQNITIEIRTDANANQTSWEIREMNTNLLVCSGGPYTGLNNAALMSTCCLPDGCYDLSVFDSAGDGITSGGYTVRMLGSNDRLIDNSAGFTGSVSSMMGAESFCVPIGTDRLIYTSCDKLDWQSNQYLVASENSAVSAVWIPGAANSLQSTNTGYEFWIFDPNGSYSFRRFRNHATSDNFGSVGATRACHMLINNWASSMHIPTGVAMNVRVRSRINGVNSEWGPACRFKIDPAAALCPVTKLMDIPGNAYLSCGQYRTFAPGQYVHARPVTGATQYQFRFRQPAEGFEVVRTTSSYFVQLWWSGQVLLTNSQYEVDVRAFKNGQWCPWGDICSLNIGTAPAGSQNVLVESVSAVGSLDIWPNPNRGDLLYMDLELLHTEVLSAHMEITNMYGKRVMAGTIAIEAGRSAKAIALPASLSAGMYLLSITAGDEVFTERFVVQP